ncbi:DUF1499 domain-containing protein [Zobellella endophytica]|uniref:DUF1499 domain-containing protein n=1 Tax=Zobellella endophytica TaxID=2116700 RepID=A0A2P7R5Z1_9GAMM|nr:DUF1499 domain-containing protein [Zobellella endophytica]PSJ45624.1 DUF1499 domain-containing protein [Zobellella endophytica]
METFFGSRLLLCSLAGLLLPLAGAIGTRLTLWHYTTGLLLVGLGLVLALPVLALALWQQHWPAAVPAALLLAVLTPFVYKGVRYPAIHDISTDTVNPPSLLAAARLRGDRDHPTGYDGEALAARQRAAWPALAPLLLPHPPARVHAATLALLERRGWQRVDNGDDRQLEAVATSLLFGFKDDVAIRLTATAGGTRVDMRSASRVGKSDLGANAHRIRTFLADLAAALSAPSAT